MKKLADLPDNQKLQEILKRLRENPPKPESSPLKTTKPTPSDEEKEERKRMSKEEKRRHFEETDEPRATKAPDQYAELHKIYPDLPYGWLELIPIGKKPDGRTKFAPVYTPSAEEEEKYKEKQETKRMSLERGKAGKIVLVEGRHDKEIAQIKNMLMTILEQPGDTMAVKREKQFAKSILGIGKKDKSRDVDLGEESSQEELDEWRSSISEENLKASIRNTRILIAKLIQADKEEIRKILEKMKSKPSGKSTAPKQPKKTPEEKAKELAEMKEKGQEALSEGFGKLKTLEDFDPSELEMMEEDLLNRELEQNMGVGWERTLQSGEKAYQISSKQLSFLSLLYENALMRHQGLDPAKARSADYERKKQQYEKEKAQKEQFVEEIKKRKEEYQKKKQQEQEMGEDVDLEEIGLSEEELANFQKGASVKSANVNKALKKKELLQRAKKLRQMQSKRKDPTFVNWVKKQWSNLKKELKDMNDPRRQSQSPGLEYTPEEKKEFSNWMDQFRGGKPAKTQSILTKIKKARTAVRKCQK